MMGGQIEAYSEPGKGSCFAFFATFRRAPGASARERGVRLPDLHRMKVLLVDDNARARAVTRQYLESFSFVVDEAADAESAQRLYGLANESGEPHALLIVDWEMPGTDGLETARRIAMAAAGERPRILLVSMHNHEYRPGQMPFVDAILAKPYTASRLFNTLVGMFAHYGAPDPDASRSPDKVRLSGAHVLLVEDNDINQQVACQILETAGIRVSIAGDGLAAVDAVESGKFDGVLMDIHMPGIDGYEATRRIRRLPGMAQLPIIAMTANAMLGDRERCLQAGMSDHVAKPVDPDEMFATMARWITPSQPGPVPSEAVLPAAAVSLPYLPGIRVEEALRRLGGDAGVYLSLLDKFRRRNAGVLAELRLAMIGGDRSGAERVAHTLKSSAGTLGAVSLQGKAGELEMRIREGAMLPMLERLLESAQAELGNLLVAVDNVLAEQMSMPPVAAGDRQLLATRVTDALALLAAFDTGAEDAVAGLQGLLPDDEKARADMVLLRESLANYDFEKAHSELLALARQLGIALKEDGK